ncbi:MAG: glycosyltransferase [bacterium]|nr:glycosyltransferase [bacterium]
MKINNYEASTENSKILKITKTKKKILVLTSTFPRWKNDTTPPFVFELEKRLAKDFDITVLAPHSQGAKKYEKLENLNIYRFQYFWPASYQKLCYEGGILPNIKKNKFLLIQGITLILFEFFSAMKLIREKKIDLIHAHWIIPQGVVALLLKKILHTPYIVTTHGGDIYGLQNKIMRHVKKIILENAEKITVVSTSIKEKILQEINRKINVEVVSMGVDSKLFNVKKYDQSIKEKYNINGPFLLFVGRLAEKKGVSFLIRAMQSVIKKFPDAKLLIIGEGTILNQLKGLSAQLGVDKNIIFLGPLPNLELPKYYATCDIVVCPSIQTDDGDAEGLPVTILEGLASGCCVVSTNTGGISDVIDPNYNGVLIKQKDILSLSNTILALLYEPKKRHYYRKNSLRTVRKYDWGNIIQSYSRLISPVT